MSQRVYINGGTLAVHADRPRLVLPEGFTSRGEYHLTIFDPKDAKALRAKNGWSNTQLSDWMKAQAGTTIPGTPKVLGIGSVTQGDNQAYFDVVEWPECQAWRASLGLEPKDLHVTAGFKESDIHGVPKDRTTLLSSSDAIRLLSWQAFEPG